MQYCCHAVGLYGSNGAINDGASFQLDLTTFPKYGRTCGPSVLGISTKRDILGNHPFRTVRIPKWTLYNSIL